MLFSTSVIEINQLKFDWNFGTTGPEPWRLPTQLDTLRMQVEVITESNYLCECFMSASAVSLCHLWLGPDDVRPASYVRIFTSVAEAIAIVDSRRPGVRGMTSLADCKS